MADEAPTHAGPGKTPIGRSLPRKEDDELLSGLGRYTTDIAWREQAVAVFVRSLHAHGVIDRIETRAARVMPGVLGVFTGHDLDAAGMGRIHCRMAVNHADGTPMRAPARAPLPTDRVRFVGEALACVVAETWSQAADAAEAVVVDVTPLTALTTSAAAWPSATALHESHPDNVAVAFRHGDADAVAAAFAGATHVVTQTLQNTRVVVNSLEPRAAVAAYDAATARWTLHTPSQGVFGLREALAGDMGVDGSALQLVTDHVGGSFGLKSQVFPEQVCVLYAARALGRPVGWANGRSESFLSDHQGRGSQATISLALDADGGFLAVRLDVLADAGAYVVAPQTVTANMVRNIIGPYRTPLLEVTSRMVFTNKAPLGSYRGAGRPEANYFMSSVIDLAARRLGIDRVALRRRNLIPPITTAHRTPGGTVYDSGTFEAVLDATLARADWDGFEVRREQSARRGLLRGRGVSLYVETTGPASKETGAVRFDDDGQVTFMTGTQDSGQGHASTFAQILADRLGVPFDRIHLAQGRSDLLHAGGGSGGSKSVMASGAALLGACAAVIEKGRTAAAEHFEASTADVEFSAGRFRVAGTDMGIGLLDLAATARGVLDVDIVVDTPPSAFPNGCHVAEVDIDPDTGVVAVVAYEATNDFGLLINPMLADGQVQGGVAQGLGQVLWEEARFDPNGQMLTGSFVDYAMPRAGDVPAVQSGHIGVPATTNPLGVKGCGEAGCAGSLPALMGAITDALASRGIEHLDMPASPERVWRVLQQAAASLSLPPEGHRGAL